MINADIAIPQVGHCAKNFFYGPVPLGPKGPSPWDLRSMSCDNDILACVKLLHADIHFSKFSKVLKWWVFFVLKSMKTMCHWINAYAQTQTHALSCYQWASWILQTGNSTLNNGEKLTFNNSCFCVYQTCVCAYRSVRCVSCVCVLAGGSVL